MMIPEIITTSSNGVKTMCPFGIKYFHLGYLGHIKQVYVVCSITSAIL